MNLREMQENAVQTVLKTSLCRAVMDGKLERCEYVKYLSDVYCYALHSAQVIGMAGVRLTLSHPPLAEYLFTHAAEELGHDKWAGSDLLDLGLKPDSLRQMQPSSACLRMIALEYLYATQWNAVGLFGWMFVLESLGGSVGGSLAACVDRTLSLDGKAMYFLKGHAQADAHHSEDLYRVIDGNVSTQDDRSAFLTMYEESLRLYCEILDNAREACSAAA